MNQEMVEKAKGFAGSYLKPIAAELDREGRFPSELIPALTEQGFWGLQYPVSYGGGGYDSETAYLVMSEFAKASAGVGLTFGVHWMACDALLKFGSEEQKQKYLMPMLKGEKIAAYTISEPQAGSDAGSIIASAAKVEAGWVLNGTKYFCTNGGIADFYFIACKTDVEAGTKGISLFIVEKGTDGFEIGPYGEKLGCRSSVTTSLIMKNCIIPEANLLGKENGGFKIAMYGLVGGRLGMVAMGLGIAEAAFEEACTYAKRRNAFGKPISKLYAIQEMVADMVVNIEVCKLLLVQTAQKRDSGKDYALDSSVAKIAAAQAVNKVCYNALQIFGGHGYMKQNAVERYVRDARLMDIGVGASEVLKMVVGAARLS